MASSTSALLGPPSFADNNLISQTAALNVKEKPPMGLTENSSPTFLSTGNPCLDFFLYVVPDTSPDDLIQRLAISWSYDPLTTMKLICNLQGVKGTGKRDKEGFYTAAFWLYQNHPETLALNLPALANFGYLKDLPEILYRILEGQQMERGKKRMWRKNNMKEISEPVDKIKTRVLRKQREFEKAKKALNRYNSDANYRLLFDQTVDLFADMLKSDLKYLNSNKVNKIGLASKWCPSVDSSYDKTTLICEAIARRIFPREEYKGIEEAHYVYRIRDRLRKQVLMPLHKALELPELSMSAKEWNLLKYNRVSSVAMKNYKNLFEEHDYKRFMEFLGDVKSGKAKIAAGALLPHEVIKQLSYDEEVAELQWTRMVEDLSNKGKFKNSLAISDVSGSMRGTPIEVCAALGLLISELNEEPWKRKVITFSEYPEFHVVTGSSLREKTEFVRYMALGTSTNFQKVFDQILEIAVENNLTDDQMIKRLFVFSDMEFNEAKGCYYDDDDDETGSNETEYVDATDSSDVELDDDVTENTMSVEELLEKMKEESKKKFRRDYEMMQRKYKENGFEDVPEIVFWNLRNSSSTPVVASMKGVAMVSGFSKNLLTLFLDNGGIVKPEDVMRLAIRGNEYKKLVVYD